MRRWNRKVLCDTAWFVALFDPRDQWHQQALAIHEENKGETRALVTHWGVISETLTLLRKRGPYLLVKAFAESLRDCRIVDVSPMEMGQVVGLFLLFSKDKMLSFVDMTTYFLATQRLDRPPILTFDSDFKRLGLHTLP